MKIELKTNQDFYQCRDVLNKLVDIVGENENHFLCPLLEFVGAAVSDYETKNIEKPFCNQNYADKAQIEFILQNFS